MRIRSSLVSEISWQYSPMSQGQQAEQAGRQVRPDDEAEDEGRDAEGQRHQRERVQQRVRAPVTVERDVRQVRVGSNGLRHGSHLRSAEDISVMIPVFAVPESRSGRARLAAAGRTEPGATVRSNARSDPW